MFAILETGGKQYKVEEGDIIEVEHIAENMISKENQVNFEEVLLIRDNDLHLGQPYVKNGKIEARILEAFKAPKVIIFKKKSKKGYKRTQGHRQMLHRLKIEKIEIDRSAGAKETTAAPKPETKTGTVKIPKARPVAKKAPKKPAPTKKPPAAKGKEKK
jgi:large subunit ribosomal protein L21